VKSDQVVLQFATEIVDVLLLFEMRIKFIKQEESRLPPRNGAARDREIVQLPERAGEGCFAALVWTRYYEYAFLTFQVEIVTHNGRVRGNELTGEGQVECLVGIDFLIIVGNYRIAELKSRAPESRNMVQIGYVELYFSVKNTDRFVKVIRVLCKVTIKL
jgi:hypothetical protein